MAAWLEINEPPWIPLYAYYVGQVVLDATLHTQIVTVAGTSGASTPAWNDAGGTTTDGSVTWQDLGLGGIAGLGITDRTNYLYMGDGDHSWSLQLRQRGTASIDLNISDTYSPYMGTQVYLNDVTVSGSTRVWAGTIDEMETRWFDRNARRILTLRLTSFEQIFDTTLVPSRLYQNKTAGYIFNDLLSLVSASPITAGTINAGANITSLLCDGTQTISDVLSQLAQASGYIWGVKISDLTAYFQTPSTTAAPFSLSYPTVLMDSLTLNESRQEFRTWQGISLGQDAFGHSSEFFTGAGQKTFTLKRPCSSVTNVWVVYPPGAQNFATGLFTGLPNDGDTITFTFPNSGSTYNWAAGAPYAVGQIVVDDAGHVQRCTFAGTSGGSTPAWSDTGGVTIDNTVIWQDDGPAGFATDSLITYTFVDVLDNTQFGQVLIAAGGTPADQALYLIQAINSSADARGLTYSLPTWENPLVNADEWLVTGAITVRNKAAGQGYVAALAESCTNFTWSDTITSGGGTGHTLVIPVGVAGTTTQGLVYTPGSADISLATPLNVGSSLQVEYIRSDVGLVAVQDDSLIAQRALIEDGTGLYQTITDGTNSLVQTSNVTGLLFAQQALEAFSNYPKTMAFDTYVPGLLPGQYINAVMTYPLASNVLLNGNWVVQEVNATLVPCSPYLAGFGHYRYTIRLISIGQTVSYLDFWEGLGGGSGGGGGQGSAFGGGSQPSALQAPVTIEGATIAPTLTLIQNTPSDNWAALTGYNVNDTILDWNGHIQLCTNGGTSGATEPYPWNSTGGTTTDGTVTWEDQGADGGLSLLAGNGRFLYNCIMGAAAFPDNTGSGVAGHFGIDALITGLATQLYIRNTTGTPLLTFDSDNTRILADARVSVTDSSAFDALIVTQNGSSRSGIYCAGSVRMVIPPSGAPTISSASEAKFYADAGGILQISQNGSAYIPLVPPGGGIAGSDTEIQYNDSGFFGASANLTWTNGSTLLRVVGTARMNAANFPDNTGSGVAGNFGVDASINGLAKLLYIRDTAGTPMLTFDSNNTRLISVSTLGITVTAAVDALAVTQNGAGSGIYCAGFMQLVTPPAGAPAVSAANQARIYCDAAGVLKVSQNGAAYINLAGAGTPGGANTQVQYNNAGAFAGSAGMVYNSGLGLLTATFMATGGLSVTSTGINITGGDLSLSSVTRISLAGAGTLTQLTISTSGLLVSAGGITVTGGITVSTGGIGVTASNIDIGAGNLLLSGTTRITNAGGAVLTAMTMNGNAGFTGTLAAAIAAGKNVDNGIIY